MKNEIIAGAASGISQNLIGHPLDTLMVLKQNKVQYKKFIQLYSGLKYPLLYSMFSYSILFPLNKLIFDVVQNQYVSGSLSGFAISPIYYGFDYLKIKRQIPTEMTISMPGIYTSIIRRTIFSGLWFGNYEYFTNQMKLSPLIAGGTSGLFSWTLIYPLEVIKNRQMSQNISFIEACKQRNIKQGYLICAFRAILVNAVGFSVYDILLNEMSTFKFTK